MGPGHMAVRRTALLIALGAILVAAVVGPLVLSRRQPPERPIAEPQLLACRQGKLVVPGDGRPICDLFEISEPLLPGGKPLSLTGAVALAKHPILLPATLPPPLAGERPYAWAIDRQVGIRYRKGSESGLVLTFSLWPSGADPAARYVSMARSWGVGDVTTIAGRSAWVIPRDAPPGPPQFSVVHVTFDRTEVTLFGRVPIENLMVVARSLRRVS
jgi:hypothetical protein